MIRCNLSVMMGKKKMNIADVHRATGLNRTTVTHLYYETAQRIEVHAVEKLCKLFECQVGDLFECVPDEEESAETK
ncbi:helix-turn-helix domain-containing protein [Rhodocyclus tenuis]|uniref:helix-turn-helix domain-containing protein n=1 Tax=Rhodocyclus gracilis TaxID=2929842 RepID=UPI001298E0EE|nr:helix-turn-helix transcriptional regulator [Rhodocyclus gracilis]MRD74128.1 helix-turn-helix domain-containing protein [Rhodocyclus gracilis]